MDRIEKAMWMRIWMEVMIELEKMKSEHFKNKNESNLLVDLASAYKDKKGKDLSAFDEVYFNSTHRKEIFSNASALDSTDRKFQGEHAAIMYVEEKLRIVETKFSPEEVEFLEEAYYEQFLTR